jgi:hypothetical protein
MIFNVAWLGTCILLGIACRCLLNLARKWEQADIGTTEP